MWIVGSDTDENSSSALKDSLTKKIEVSGGSIAVMESYGKRTLAHSIMGQSEGHYFLSRFTLDSSRLKEVETEIVRDAKIIRHLLTKVSSDKPLLSPSMMDDIPDFRLRRSNKWRA